MTNRIELNGIYFDGIHPRGTVARLVIDGDRGTLIRETATTSLALEDLRVSPRIGKAERFVQLSDRAQLQCVDGGALDRLSQEEWSEGPIAWLERHTPVAVLCAVVVLVCGALLIEVVAPKVAREVAARVPLERLQELDEAVLGQLDQSFFEPSRLSEEDIARYEKAFVRVRDVAPQSVRYRLLFRKFGGDSPNAFSLPGGTLVVTDGVVSACPSDECIQAVLAHEIGHVAKRHTMQAVVANSMVATAAVTMMGDASTVAVFLSTALVTTSYSRAMEREADEFAYALLEKAGISPEHFAYLLEALEEEEDEDGSPLIPLLLSTHPATRERIERARKAAGLPDS